MLIGLIHRPIRESTASGECNGQGWYGLVNRQGELPIIGLIEGARGVHHGEGMVRDAIGSCQGSAADRARRHDIELHPVWERGIYGPGVGWGPTRRLQGGPGIRLIHGAWRERRGRDRGRDQACLDGEGQRSLGGLRWRGRVAQGKAVRTAALRCWCTGNRAARRVEEKIGRQGRDGPRIGGDAACSADGRGVGLIRRAIWEGRRGDSQWSWASVGRRSRGRIVAAGQPAERKK